MGVCGDEPGRRILSLTCSPWGHSGRQAGRGDSWNAGFYYGLLGGGINGDAIAKEILVGDATTRIKQTLIFDLAIVDKGEVQALMREDILGGGKRTVR